MGIHVLRTGMVYAYMYARVKAALIAELTAC
jgi:hypothetical protein